MARVKTLDSRVQNFSVNCQFLHFIQNLGFSKGHLVDWSVFNRTNWPKTTLFHTCKSSYPINKHDKHFYSYLELFFSGRLSSKRGGHITGKIRREHMVDNVLMQCLFWDNNYFDCSNNSFANSHHSQKAMSFQTTR